MTGFYSAFGGALPRPSTTWYIYGMELFCGKLTCIRLNTGRFKLSADASTPVRGVAVRTWEPHLWLASCELPRASYPLGALLCALHFALFWSLLDNGASHSSCQRVYFLPGWAGCQVHL